MGECNRDQYINENIVLPGIRKVQFDAETINSFTIANEVIAAADTEQSYSFPSGTKGFEIAARDKFAKLQISFTSGQSNSLFRTVPYGVTWGKTGLDSSTSFTVYFQSPKVGATIEIVSWS